MIIAAAHGLRLFDDYQYASCVSYKNICGNLDSKKQLPVKDRLKQSRRLALTAPTGLVAQGIKPNSADLENALAISVMHVVRYARPKPQKDLMYGLENTSKATEAGPASGTASSEEYTQ